MAERKRLTWGDKGAAAPPATPVEEGGYRHPADTTPDPGAHDYEIGTTSSFGEDVHPHEKDPAERPATPAEEGGHPAAKKAALFRHAQKCISIAQAMLGKEVPAGVIEEQAYSMFGWDSAHVDSTLRRVASTRKKGYGMMDEYGMDDMDVYDDIMEEDVMMDEPMDGFMEEEPMGLYGQEDEDEDVMGRRWASKEDRMLVEMLREQKQASRRRRPRRKLSAEDRMLAEMLREARQERLAAKKAEEDDEVEVEEETEEVEAGKKASVEDLMLAEMLRDAAKKADDDEDDEDDDDDNGEEEVEVEEDDDNGDDDKEAGKKKAFFEDIEDVDPMGFLDKEASSELSEEEHQILMASLYENNLMEAVRMANEDGPQEGQGQQHPRPRKPAKVASPQRLGQVIPEGTSERDQIEKLSAFWGAPEDVSEHFGIPPTHMDLDD